MKGWLWFFVGMAMMWVIDHPGQAKAFVMQVFGLLGSG